MVSASDGLDPAELMDLQDKEREAELLLSDSVQELRILGRELREGVLDRRNYDRRVALIEARIHSAEEELGDLRRQLGVSRDDGEKGGWRFNYHDFMVNVVGLKIFLLPILVVIGLFYVYSHSTCVSFVGDSVDTPRLVSIIHEFEEDSPFLHQLVCKNVDVVNIGLHPGAYSYLSDESRTVSIGKGSLEFLHDIHIAGILIEGACTFKMFRLYGGVEGAPAEVITAPCENMRHMYLYETGYFESYDEMISSFREGRYVNLLGVGKAEPGGSVKALREHYMGLGGGELDSFCGLASVNSSRIGLDDGFCLRILNSGKTRLLSGLVRLSVNGADYPLELFELRPGGYHDTCDYLSFPESAEVSLSVAGCG